MRFSQRMPTFWIWCCHWVIPHSALTFKVYSPNSVTTQNTWYLQCHTVLPSLHVTSTSTKHMYHKYLLVTGTNIILSLTPHQHHEQELSDVCVCFSTKFLNSFNCMSLSCLLNTFCWVYYAPDILLPWFSMLRHHISPKYLQSICTEKKMLNY
jgi:hypothetical protein